MADHLVAFWNLENLFGPEAHPHRLDWVKKDLKNSLDGWTEALYRTKLDQLTRIIRQMRGGAGPDILGVCEVEDEHVLDDLVATLNAALPGRQYDTVFKSRDHSSRGIDTAFVYDAALFEVDKDNLVFAHFVMRRTGTRDILQATYRSRATGRDLVVMANHWPSRFGGRGAEASAGFRATAGETLSYWHGRIFEEAADGDRTPVIALGDMNDDPWDRSLTINALATRERGDVERGTSPKFYNATWEYMLTPVKDHKGKDRLLEGTLYFSKNGNLFDQILLNRPLLDRKTAAFKLVDGSAGVIAFPEMVSHRTGEGPRRFGLPKGDAAKNVDPTGFSDHFPVGVMVRDG